MIDTNALLSIAFSMITNFANIVGVPRDAIPQAPEDLTRCVIGSPDSPVHLILTHRSGTEFWVGHGSVYAYSSPRSYFNSQSSTPLDKFYGTTTLTSNDVVRIAASALQRLAKSEAHLANANPRIRYPTSPRIPFFQVKWFLPIHDGGLDTLASVEIDGRDGQIVRLLLHGAAFADLAFDHEIKRKVYTPDAVDRKFEAKRFAYPKPTTNYVEQALRNWLHFCGRLGLEAGGQTSITDINWEDTFVYTNPVCPTVQTCRVTFNNRTTFESIDAFPFNHFSPDAAFTGRYMSRPKAEWALFEGTVTKEWELLAKALQTRIVEQFAVPRSLFETSLPEPTLISAKLGETGLARTLIYWRRPIGLSASITAEQEQRSLLSAEFDLRTGQTKFVDIQDVRLIHAIRASLQAPK